MSRLLATCAVAYGGWLAAAAAQEIMSAEQIAARLSFYPAGIMIEMVDGVPISLGLPELTRVSLDTVRFEFNSAELTPLAKRQLDEVARALGMTGFGHWLFSVGGHTDAVGSDAYNQALSQWRAEAAVDYLVNVGGIDRGRLVAMGWGESRPIDPADPESGANRRVEISRVQ